MNNKGSRFSDPRFLGMMKALGSPFTPGINGENPAASTEVGGVFSDTVDRPLSNLSPQAQLLADAAMQLGIGLLQGNGTAAGLGAGFQNVQTNVIAPEIQRRKNFQIKQDILAASKDDETLTDLDRTLIANSDPSASLEALMKRRMAAAGLQNRVQSSFTNEEGERVLIMADGSIRQTGMNDRNPYILTKEGDMTRMTDRVTGETVLIDSPEEVGSRLGIVRDIVNKTPDRNAERRVKVTEQNLDLERDKEARQRESDRRERLVSAAKIRAQVGNVLDKRDNVSGLIRTAIDQVGPFSAGTFGGNVTKQLGPLGANSRNLGSTLSSIRANMGFDQLEAMRQASPNGSALGNVTEREIQFLQGVLEDLEQTQSPQQLKKKLIGLDEKVRGSYARIQQAYEETYGLLTNDTPQPSGFGGTPEDIGFTTTPSGPPAFIEQDPSTLTLPGRPANLDPQFNEQWPSMAEDWEFMTPEERALFLRN